MNLVFKVLNKNKMSSAMSRGEARVIYKSDKWIRPPEWLKNKGYGILAFKEKKYAEDWLESIKKSIDENKDLKIYKAYANNYTHKLPKFLNMKELEKGKIIKLDNWEFPKGSIMCDKIKVIGNGK